VRLALSRGTLAAAASIALGALSAHAGPVFSPLDRGILEQTTLVPATQSVTAYTVPPNVRVVLKRFCRDDCVRCEGAILGSKAFEAQSGRCVEHPHGLELPPGETVRCTNACTTMGAALFSGVLRP